MNLQWLAGIIDAEGSLDIKLKQAKTGAKYLAVEIHTADTDIKTMKRISELYVDLNLKFYYVLAYWHRSSLRRALGINIASKGSCLKLLNQIVYFLVGKKDQAQIMIKLIEFVQSFHKDGKTSTQNYWEDPIMIGLLKEYKQAKDWYFDPSTTTRRASSIVEFDDIV